MARKQSTAQLVLHPVRLRIIQALVNGGPLSTAQIDAALGDVPTATLYRHIAVLADAGVLEVASERRVRGAVERSYRLHIDAAEISAGEIARMTPDEHKQAFTSFVAGLLSSFDSYVEEGDVDLARDGVTYRQAALWLSDDELGELLREVGAAFARRLDHEPRDGRVRRQIATIVIPDRGVNHSQSCQHSQY